MGIIGENIIFLPGCIIGLFVGLIVGAASDRVTFKYGRRRIFIVLGIFPTVIGLCGMAFYDKISKNGSKYIFVASVILMCFGVNLIQGPSRALCSDVTPISQQNFMAGCCQVFSGFSLIVSNILGSIDIKCGILDNNNDNFLIIISAVLAFIALTIQFFAATEEPLRIKPPKSNPFQQTFQSFKQMPRPFGRVLPAFFLANVATYQYNIKFASFMGKDIFHDSEEGKRHAMRCNIVNNVVQLLYGFINNKVVDKFGMKPIMVIGNLVMSVGLMCFFFLSQLKYVNYFYCLTGLIGLGQVIYMTIPYALVSMVIPTEQLANNFGVLNSFLVFGQLFSILVVNNVVYKFYGTSDEATKVIGFSSIFGFLGTILSFIVVQPSLAEIGNYDQIKDLTGTSDNSGFRLRE